MKVSFAIQAHPRRAESAARLAARVGGDVEVVFDPDPDSKIRSPWRTFRHLFETTPTEATHRAQLQDDAVVCDGYRRAVERAVEARPDRLLVFFIGGNPHLHARAVMTACYYDEPWAELNCAMWCPVVATVWPAQLARDMVAWNDAQEWPERFTSDDERVGRFLRDVRHTPLASVPSLAEHPDVGESLIGRRARAGEDPGRVAACFIGEGCGACVDEIDWTAGPGAERDIPPGHPGTVGGVKALHVGGIPRDTRAVIPVR